MRLYAETGRRGAALRQYQLCVAAFQRELRAEPEAETKALYQEILRRSARSLAAPEGSPVGGVSPVALSLPRHVAPEPAGVAEPPLIGRERDLARLLEALEHARAGRGGLVLVGEVGIGKTRLVAELTAAATQRGGRVLIGRCYETERILPFAPWVDALRTGQVLEERELLDTLELGWRSELGRLLPELPGAPPIPASVPIGRGGNARHLFEAIGELLARMARRHLLVVVLEDLHWADEMSVRLLAFLGRRLHAVPLLVLGDGREEELADSALLRQTLDELDVSGQLERITVAPLSRADTTALVRVLAPPGSLTRWPSPRGGGVAGERRQRLRRRGGDARASRRGTVAGTPDLPLPNWVRALVRQRLERLSERGRRLVAAAAVIGRQFDFPLVQRAADLSEREAAEGVEELVRHRVLRGSGEGLEFSHDRVREVAAEDLAPPLRVALHRRVAESLEKCPGRIWRRTRSRSATTTAWAECGTRRWRISMRGRAC